MDKKYLLLRKRGWYVRYAIPLKVQHHFGKSEFVVSLRTRSFEEAKIKKLQYLEAFTRAISAHLNFDINQESTKENIATLERDTLELNTLENQKEHQEINPSQEKSRISFLLDLFLFEQRKTLSTYTWQRKQKNIRKFIQFIGDINIASVSKNQFRAFFDQAIMPYNLSRNTVLGKLSDIGSIFNWALLRGCIQANPVKGFASTLSIPRKTSASEDANQPLSQKMLLDLLHHLKDENDLFTITIIGMYTGMRIEEICRLKRSDIEADCFLVREGKTQSAPRKIPVHSIILPMLESLTDTTRDEYLVTGLKTYRDKRSHSISKRFGTRRNQLGFDKRKYTFHSLRANFVTELDNLGIDLSIIQSLIGHRQQSLVRSVYSGGPKIEKLREVINKIDYGLKITKFLSNGITSRCLYD